MSVPPIPSSLRRATAGRLAALLLLAALVPGCGPRPPVDAPEVPWSDEGRAVALVVDADALARADAAWSNTDREWIELLTSEFGGVDVIRAERLRDAPQAITEGRSLLVLPRRTFEGIPSATLETLDRLVETGLDVLVEAPDTTHVRWLGLELASVERMPLLPWPYDLVRPASESREPGLALMPRPIAFEWTAVRYAPSFQPVRRARVMQSAASRPAIWSLQRGRGSWVVVASDFGEWTHRWNELPRSVRSGHESSAPWLAAWRGFVLAGEAAGKPWPRWGRQPASHEGWLVTGADPTTEHDAVVFEGPQLSTRDVERWRVRFGASVRGALAPAVAAADEAGPWSDWARSQGFAVTDAATWRRWRQARAQSPLRWTLQEDILHVEVQAHPDAEPGLVLELPRRWQNRALVEWRASWSPVPARPGQRFDTPVLLLDVPAGTRGTVEAEYR